MAGGPGGRKEWRMHRTTELLSGDKETAMEAALAQVDNRTRRQTRWSCGVWMFIHKVISYH